MLKAMLAKDFRVTNSGGFCRIQRRSDVFYRYLAVATHKGENRNHQPLVVDSVRYGDPRQMCEKALRYIAQQQGTSLDWVIKTAAFVPSGLDVQPVWQLLGWEYKIIEDSHRYVATIRPNGQDWVVERSSVARGETCNTLQDALNLASRYVEKSVTVAA